MFVTRMLLFNFQKMVEKKLQGRERATIENCFKLLSERITYNSSDVYKLSNNVKSPDLSKQDFRYFKRFRFVRKLCVNSSHTLVKLLALSRICLSLKLKKILKNCFVRQHALNIFCRFFFVFRKKHKKKSDNKKRIKNSTNSH